MTLFQETLSTINRELDLSYRKIEILNSLRDVARVLTSEEQETLDKIQRTNTGIIALLLEHKAAQYKRKDPSSTYQPFIIDTDKDKIDFLQHIETFPVGVPYRYDFIIGGSGKHATPVTIIRDESGKTSIFSLDAAVFYDNFSYLSLLQNASRATNVFNYEDGGIQNSSYGCTIYSIQHLSAMSKMSEIELTDMFQAAFDKQTCEQYKGFTPKIVRNIQSIKSYTEYVREQVGDPLVSKRKTFAEHVDINKRTIRTEGSESKDRNFAHTYKTHKYLLRAQELMNGLTQEEFDEIVFKRSVQNVIETARHFSVLFEERDGVSECKQFIEVDYKVALARRELNLTIEKLEREGHSISRNLIEFRNPKVIEAVHRLGIDEEEAMRANCFRDPLNKGIAISFLRKAYRKKTHHLMANGAQQLFEIIKENYCRENGEIKKLYDAWMKKGKSIDHKESAFFSVGAG